MPRPRFKNKTVLASAIAWSLLLGGWAAAIPDTAPPGPDPACSTTPLEQCVRGSGFFRVSDAGGQTRVAFGCDALAAAGASSTTIRNRAEEGCALKRDGTTLATASGTSFPGSFASTAAVRTIEGATRGLQVCWRVIALFTVGAAIYDERCRPDLDAPTPDPSAVDELAATRVGGTLSVAGSVTFGGGAPVLVGTDAAGDSAQSYPAEMGLDVIAASVAQPDPESGDLAFLLDLVDLPATGGIPEQGWYHWDFSLTTPDGERSVFAWMGRLTHIAHDLRVPDFLLQFCPSGAPPCEEVEGAELDVVMDGQENRITVTVPRSVLEEVSGAPLAGASLRVGGLPFPNGAAAMATYGNNAMGPPHDHLQIDGSYMVGGKQVSVGLVPAGAPPVFDEQATLAPDGSFSASVDMAGLASGAYDLWARACFGTNCATRSIAVTA